MGTTPRQGAVRPTPVEEDNIGISTIALDKNITYKHGRR